MALTTPLAESYLTTLAEPMAYEVHGRVRKLLKMASGRLAGADTRSRCSAAFSNHRQHTALADARLSAPRALRQHASSPALTTC